MPRKKRRFSHINGSSRYRGGRGFDSIAAGILGLFILVIAELFNAIFNGFSSKEFDE